MSDGVIDVPLVAIVLRQVVPRPLTVRSVLLPAMLLASAAVSTSRGSPPPGTTSPWWWSWWRRGCPRGGERDQHQGVAQPRARPGVPGGGAGRRHLGPRHGRPGLRRLGPQRPGRGLAGPVLRAPPDHERPGLRHGLRAHGLRPRWCRGWASSSCAARASRARPAPSPPRRPDAGSSPPAPEEGARGPRRPSGAVPDRAARASRALCCRCRTSSERVRSLSALKVSSSPADFRRAHNRCTRTCTWMVGREFRPHGPDGPSHG